MKKIILGICDNTSERVNHNGGIINTGIVNLMIIDTTMEKGDNDFPIIRLKTNTYNRLSRAVLKDLLSSDNQIYILVPGEDDSLSKKEIIQNTRNLVKAGLTPPRFCLTQRQRDIMDLAVKRLSIQQIADNLCRSYHTIKNHFSNIYEKMGVRSLPEAIDKYLEYRKRMN